MNWKKKAFIINIISKLPDKMSLAAYYRFQRHLGSLRNEFICPYYHLKVGKLIADYINQFSKLTGRSYIEIGTGRRLNIPIALWLCGAKKAFTVDINLLLKKELIKRDVECIKENPEKIKNIFSNYIEDLNFKKKFDILVNMKFSLKNLLELLNLSYLAPTDARKIHLPDNSVDFHISYTVLEHIPKDILLPILIEGKRILASDGLFVHLVDLSDHFSHSDPSISTINFLQYSELEWNRYSDNRFMYQNRLRFDDYSNLFKDAGLKLLLVKKFPNDKALKLLTNGFPLYKKFVKKPYEINAIQNEHFVAN